MTGTIELDREGRHLLIGFPYREDLVDVVRNLPGRRWDRGSKMWKVPAEHAELVIDTLLVFGFEIAPEVSSIMAGTSIVPPKPEKEEKPEAPKAGEDENNPLSIKALNERVRDAIKGAFPSKVLVTGEVLNFDKNKDRKHIFFSLVEKAPGGQKIAANVDIAMFERTAQKIIPLLEIQGLSLQDGIEILVEARVDLYPATGRYQLILEDIKPEFTLGKLAQNREKILAELQDKGFDRLNLAIPLPVPALRVGILASPDSDGWNDFRKQLESSEIGFDLTLYGIKVQGDLLKPTILQGLRWFAKRSDEFDVLCIIRGGGSRADLAWFDDKDVAFAVAQHPTKIICGIGHERDQSVLDFITHSEKTPTATGAYLVNAVLEAGAELDAQARRLVDASRGILTRSREQLTALAQGIRRVLHGRISGEHERLAAAADRLATGTKHLVRSESNQLLGLRERLRAAVRGQARHQREILANASTRLVRGSARRIERERSRLDTASARQRLLDPTQVLKRGFAMIRDTDGKITTGTDKLSTGQKVTLVLRDGEAGATIDDIQPKTET